MKKTWKGLLCALLATGLVACAPAAPASSEPGAVSPAPSAPTPAPVELSISAASSLTDVLTTIGDQYMVENPQVTLTFSFDSSGTLQTQIEEGAPADLFLSAAQKQMDALEAKGLVDTATRVNLLENQVVLVVPPDSTLALESFADVATDKVTLAAIGDETVPVGQYTQEIYQTLGLWEAVKAKANLGTNVRSVLAWVETGEVDCGIVYATDAATTHVQVICAAPAGSCKPVVYPAAALACAQSKEAAQAFLDYLSTDAATTAFTQAGFTPVQPTAG